MGVSGVPRLGSLPLALEDSGSTQYAIRDTRYGARRAPPR